MRLQVFFFSIILTQKSESLRAEGSANIKEVEKLSRKVEENLSDEALIGAGAFLKDSNEYLTTTDTTSNRTIVRLAEGETLRILAEKLFGNREFWVYIYLENKDVISDPNRVPAGISLYIPNQQHYDINSADPLSVSRAKEMGDQIIQS